MVPALVLWPCGLPALLEAERDTLFLTPASVNRHHGWGCDGRGGAGGPF